MKVLEGSQAIAEAVALARPHVVAAYPITPQTHIVERLAGLVTTGELGSEYLTVESEHSAASAVLGASATGARAYTATSSQGLLHMAEVVFNIAGMRLPVVMTLANRALGAPLSIWNDHQDSMALRDAGWIQLFAQTAQEAHDLHVLAFRLAEDPRVLCPVMICVDGFVLTHAFEQVELLTPEQADRLIPPTPPRATLDPAQPLTLGTYAEPFIYTEARRAVSDALDASGAVLAEALHDLEEITGRRYDPAFDLYRADDASVILVAMGTAAQTARVVIDQMRAAGTAAGLLALRSYRPFPAARIASALEGSDRVVVLDRSVSLGARGGIVAGEVRDALYASSRTPVIVGVTGGLGGRDVSLETLQRALTSEQDSWIDLRTEALR